MTEPTAPEPTAPEPTVTERTMTTLSSRTLADVTPGVPVPGYDRDAVQVGIVHIGVGGFHRAHQAMYVDRLLDSGSPEARQWGICGVGLLPGDKRMAQVMADQDGLYTLLVLDPDGSSSLRVIGSIVRYLYAPEQLDDVLDVIAAEQTRIVTLTVTEGGYNLDPVSHAFDEANPDIVRDLVPGAMPTTMFGVLAEAFQRRRQAGRGGITVVSCDNIEANGDTARDAICAFAELRDPALAEWIRAQVTFPNSMVDRITPVTTDEDRAEVARRLGLRDAWPVTCESFTQWVLEDRFAAGRPALEQVGVDVVDDVEPYELMKLRLLNGGHQALCYLGSLLGHRLVREAITDDVLHGFVADYMAEALPTLREVPGIDLQAYCRTLLERFANPQIGDTLARLAQYGSDRIPKFVLPAIRENLAAGRSVQRGAMVIAAWARYCAGSDEAGAPIAVDDHRADQLRAAAHRQAAGDSTAFIADRALFGDLIDDDRFNAAFVAAVESMREVGARQTLLDLSPA